MLLMPSGILVNSFEGLDGRFFCIEKSSSIRSRTNINGRITLMSPSLNCEINVSVKVATKLINENLPI